jgi:hypothetical protein
MLAAAAAHAGDVAGGAPTPLPSSGLTVTLPAGESWSVTPGSRTRGGAPAPTDVITRRTPGRAGFTLEVRLLPSDCTLWLAGAGPADLLTAYAPVVDAPYWLPGLVVFARDDRQEATGCVDLENGNALELAVIPGVPGSSEAPAIRGLLGAVAAAGGGARPPVPWLGNGAPPVDGVLRLPQVGIDVRVPAVPANTEWIATESDEMDLIRWRVVDDRRLDRASAAALVPVAVQVEVKPSLESCAFRRAATVRWLDGKVVDNPFPGGPWESTITVNSPANSTSRFSSFCLETAAGSTQLVLRHVAAPDPALFGALVNAVGDALLAKHGAPPAVGPITVGKLSFTLPGAGWRRGASAEGVVVVPTGSAAPPWLLRFDTGAITLLCERGKPGAPWLGAGWRMLTDGPVDDGKGWLRIACVSGRSWMLASIGSPREFSAADDAAIRALLDDIGRQLPPAMDGMQIALGFEVGPMTPDAMGGSSGSSVLYTTRVFSLPRRGVGPFLATRVALGYGGGGAAYDITSAAGGGFALGPVAVGAGVGFGIDNIGVLTEADSHIGLGVMVQAQAAIRVLAGPVAVTAQLATCPRTGPNQTRFDLGATWKKRARAVGWRLGLQVIDYEDLGTYTGASVSVDMPM